MAINIERLQVNKDGNAYFVHLDDFVDLQESPAIFFERESWQGKVITEWWEATPLMHLPLVELIRIAKELNK